MTTCVDRGDECIFKWDAASVVGNDSAGLIYTDEPDVLESQARRFTVDQELAKGVEPLLQAINHCLSCMSRDGVVARISPFG